MWRDLLGATSRICFNADDGTGTGGNEGDSSQPPAGGETDQPPAWVSDLVKGIGEQFSGAITPLLNEVRGLKSASASEEIEEREEEENDDYSEADLEAMPRAKFAEHLKKSIVNAVQKTVVKPLSEQVRTVASHTQASTVAAEVKEVAAENKDFWDWQQEMLALAKQHPTLNPRRLYYLARSENPEKAQAMDKKYKSGSSEESEAGKEGDGQNKSKKIPISFGGLTPSGATGGRKSMQEKMDKSSAADKAWEETVRALGGEPLFQE